MSNVLITGVAGLLGSRMAEWILDNTEYSVIGIDNLQGGYLENIDSRVKFYKRDLAENSIEDIFKKYSIDYVFHFAAYAAEGLSPFIRKFNWKNNALSTADVINCCITYNVKRLVYTSSMSVYGDGVKNERFYETNIPDPQDPYAISKYACEMDIISASKTHNLDYCIIRPHNVYGINQNIWDRYRNVLGIWMLQRLNNKPMTIYGDGEQMRAFSYIDDCLRPMWLAATKEQASKQIINLGGIKEYTINEAANILLEIIGDYTIEHLEPRYEVKYAVPSWEKSVEILEYNETVDLKKGLYNMWEWAKKQPHREQQIWKEYEIDKNLYSYWKNNV